MPPEVQPPFHQWKPGRWLLQFDAEPVAWLRRRVFYGWSVYRWSGGIGASFGCGHICVGRLR